MGEEGKLSLRKREQESSCEYHGIRHGEQYESGSEYRGELRRIGKPEGIPWERIGMEAGKSADEVREHSDVQI